MGVRMYNYTVARISCDVPAIPFDDMIEEFDKMQIVFKAIRGGFGHTRW